MADAAEVRVRIVLDDAARAAANRLKEDLHGVHQESAGAAHSHEEMGASLKEMAVEAAELFAVYEVGKVAIETVVDLTKEAFEAANDLEQENKRLASSLALMTPGKSFEELTTHAEELHDQLEDIGIASGVSTEALGEAFATIGERSNMTSTQVKDLTEKMAEVGKVMPGGVQSLSEGFAMMEAGVVRARNPIVMLIAQTGILHGNAKAVAAQLGKMTPDKQMEVAQQAIEKMSQRVKGMPLDFNQVVQSIKDIWKAVMESGGGPIFDAVKRVANEIREFLMAHQAEIEAFAAAVGTRIGEFVDFVADIAKEVIDVFSDDATNAEGSLNSAMDEMLDIWDEIKDNAHAIVAAFKDVFNLAKEIWDGIMTAQRVIAGIATGGLSEVGRMGLGMDNVFTGKSGGGSVMPWDQQTQGDLDSHTKRMWHEAERAFQKIAADPQQLVKAEDAFRKAASAAGMSAQEVDRYTQSLKEQRKASIDSDPLASAFDTASKGVATNFSTNLKTGMMEAGGYTGPDVSMFVDAFNAASQAHDQAAMQYGAHVLESNKQLQQWLLDSGAIADGAITGLGDLIHDSVLKNLVQKQEAVAEKALKGAGPTYNFTGGQTFNIKQDFRDQDPDRVAIVFRRDILNAAVSRGQSRLAGAFGT